jgi:hypothetical protein
MDAIEFIDIIRPEHDRTSCSDDDINNGFFTRNGGDWHGRCTRCMYLQIIENDDDWKKAQLSGGGFDPEDCFG